MSKAGTRGLIATLKTTALAVMLGATLFGTQAMAVEEPAYKAVLQKGAFEVRDYPALVVAEVTVSGDQKEAAGKGFRLLAGYIFGGNTRRQSIAMTAPVAQAPASEKIAMTAPVTQSAPRETIAMTAPVTQQQGTGSWTVQFIMPSGYTLETLPKPAGADVQLREEPAVRRVAIRFSGWWSDPLFEQKNAELQSWLQKK